MLTQRIKLGLIFIVRLKHSLCICFTKPLSVWQLEIYPLQPPESFPRLAALLAVRLVQHHNNLLVHAITTHVIFFPLSCSLQNQIVPQTLPNLHSTPTRKKREGWVGTEGLLQKVSSRAGKWNLPESFSVSASKIVIYQMRTETSSCFHVSSSIFWHLLF